MGLRQWQTPAPAPMTLVANSQKEAWLLLLFEAYREPVTDRRLAAYLPRVAPFSDDELKAAVNTWVDNPEHTQAPAPGQLKDLLERRRQWATPATEASAIEDLPSWQQPPPPEEEGYSPQELQVLLSTLVGNLTMPSPPQTPRHRRPRAEVDTKAKRSEEVAAQIGLLRLSLVSALQRGQLTQPEYLALKQRLRDFPPTPVRETPSPADDTGAEIVPMQHIRQPVQTPRATTFAMLDRLIRCRTMSRVMTVPHPQFEPVDSSPTLLRSDPPRCRPGFVGLSYTWLTSGVSQQRPA